MKKFWPFLIGSYAVFLIGAIRKFSANNYGKARKLV
jgi:hypothetical protein